MKKRERREDDKKVRKTWAERKPSHPRPNRGRKPNTGSIQMSSYFNKLIFNSDTASKHKKESQVTKMFSISLTKCQCVIRKQHMWHNHFYIIFWPQWKPSKSPLSIVVDIILFRVSITTAKGRGDNGSPCLKPWVLLKILEEAPFVKMENRTIEIQNSIHARHFSPKPLLFNKYNKISQFLWSQASSRFNLHNKLGTLDLSWLLLHSFATKPESRICLLLINAFCKFDMIFSNTCFNLFFRTLDIIL